MDSLLEAIDKASRENARDGKHTVIILDEAHMIESEAAFDVVRLLLNFFNTDGFLVTLIFVGHPELAMRLSTLKQLSQRVPISCTLTHFERYDTAAYIEKRMSIAGNGTSPFLEDALELIHRNSGGIPRRINTLCDLSLTLGCAKKADRIDALLVQEAADKFGVIPAPPATE
jgi:general secretion pathway protein A